MLKFSRISIIIILTAVFIIYAQPQFKKIFVKRTFSPQVNYSSVLKKFLIADYNGDRAEYYDEDGKTYNRVLYQLNLPMTYYRNLSMWNKLPKQIDGVELTPVKIDRSRQFTMIRGTDFDCPAINLFPLYESASIFSELEEPDSMFRITSSMEFLDGETNSIDKERSELFTKALKAKGFKFPARNYYGNPTTRKPFDEGYFIEDSSGKIFHLKMKKTRPFVEDTGIQPESGIEYIKFEEDTRMEYYGVMVTGNNEIFLITYDNYKLVKLPVDNFNSKTMSFLMICDMLKRTIKIDDADNAYTIVTDNSYNVIDSHHLKVERYDEDAKKYSNLLFPLIVKRSAPNSKFIHFSMEYKKTGIFSAFTALLIIIGFLKLKGYRLKDHIADFVIVGVAGIPAMIAFFVVGGYRSTSITQ